MKSKFFVERKRILLTRIFVFFIFLILIFSESAWDVNNPMLSTMIFSLGIFLVSIASMGRLWCSLYIAGYKTVELIMEGPYSLCRNPLYLFSLIGLIGLGFSAESLSLTILLVTVFAFYYPFVIKKEEQRLLEIHGASFETYKKSMPAFIPRFSGFKEPQDYSVNPIIFRSHIFSALWFIWIVAILKIVEAMHEIGILPVYFKLY